MNGFTAPTPPAVFDAVAARYDAEFTATPLARALRAVVWLRLAALVRPGMRVLEIGCGTGEDAVWLARRGVEVVASDVSPAMLDAARRKAEQSGVSDRVEMRVLDAASLPPGMPGRFDAAFSNFGALNCVRDLRPIASALAQWVRPAGPLVLVFMHRACAWEMGWHALHLQPRAAFRRLSQDGVQARVGDGVVRVWYPSIGAIRRAFAPEFRLRRATGLGVFLPPSYLEPVVAKRPRLFQWLVRLERVASSIFPFNRLADHVIVEFERAVDRAAGTHRIL